MKNEPIDHAEAERMLAEARRQIDAKAAEGPQAVHPIIAGILADFDRAFGVAE